ncbi:MAG: hypothetical protein E7039_03050 [Lentisphaerae bacterium]|nr:hypothetical protein [Lentisphaerota bacterium]
MKFGKLFLTICKHLPAPHWQMQLQQYNKISNKVPELAGEVWNFMNDNRKFMKKYSGNYKIVSLGADCMPRTYPTVYMLKPCRAAGEKSMPFDLARTPPQGLVRFLENDFADYINDKWQYDHENGRWLNDPATGVWYSHDRDCGPDQLAELHKRVQRRINNFHEMLKFPGLVFFLLHKRLEGDIKDIDRACAALRKMRKDLPTKIVVIANDQSEEPSELENAEYFLLKHPLNAHDWFEPEVRFTVEGIHYEMQVVKLIRQLLQKELGV